MTPGPARAAAWIFALNLALGWRILLPGATPYRGSIEGGYAAMGRMIAANPDYLSWNPLQYCGLPVHFMYLPGVPYLDALLLWLTGAADAIAVHRILCALALFAGPAATLYLVDRWTGSRTQAVLSALAVSLLSPLYTLIGPIATDIGIMRVPWREQTLIKYGEGPHTVGLLLALIALALVRNAAISSGSRAVIAASAALAATVLTNWVAGLGLAFAVATLLAVHGSDAAFRSRRVVIAGVVGYGLAAFWLTPSFVVQMATNWPRDAFGYQFQVAERMAVAIWAIGIVTLWFALRRARVSYYTAWLTLCTFGFGLPVWLYYRFGLDVLPESRRYAIEFELFLLLLAVDLILRLRASRLPALRRAGAVAILALAYEETPHLVRYLTHFHADWVTTPWEQTIDQRIANALQGFGGQSRALVTGTPRFQLNALAAVPQMSGVFETGLKTRLAPDVYYQVRSGIGLTPGQETAESVRLLRALGVEYVVVHGDDSEEYYRDFKNPEHFETALETVWKQGDDRIYRLPSSPLAHIVQNEELPVAPWTAAAWAPYVAAMDDPERPRLTFQWTNARRAEIRGAMNAGQRVAISLPWDPNFHASVEGREITLERAATGLSVTAPLPTGAGILTLDFVPSIEERAGQFVSAATVLGCFWTIFAAYLRGRE